MGGFQGSAKYKGLSYYSASKAALVCLTECLANEFTESGISVNCLALGQSRRRCLMKHFPVIKLLLMQNKWLNIFLVLL
jgi:NAD(P)-dependent dehydrogenase (short-subunit alcohol dehydrogenase family)